jgi:RNA polymerase sigma-70 factor (ECF subfamily)
MTDRSLLSEGFEDLFRLYAKGLVVYAMEYTRNRQEAEDVVHDVFVSFWERMRVIKGDNIKAYLFRSTRNRCLDHLARRKVRSEYSRMAAAEEWEFDFDGFVESELEKRIAAAMAKLPPRQRKVMIMSRFDGMSTNEISSELGISPRTVEKHIEMAVRTLRTELGGLLPTMLFYLLFM